MGAGAGCPAAGGGADSAREPAMGNSLSGVASARGESRGNRLGTRRDPGFDLGMPVCRTLALASAACLLASAAAAQGFSNLSRSMQNTLAPERYGVFLASLVDLSRENELAAARYRLEGGVDTAVDLLSLPFQTTLATKSPDTSVFVEGVASYLVAEADIADLFEGTLPGLEASARADWQVGTASLGAGPQLRIDDHFSFTPVWSLGYSHIRNETLLAGPGAAAARTVFDDVLFNWNASSVLIGTSLRGEGHFDLGGDYELDLLARFDLVHVESLHAVNTLQEFDANVVKATTIARLQGPTGWKVGDQSLVWHADFGHRAFFGRAQDVLGVDQMWEFGTGVEVNTSTWLGPIAKLKLSGAVAFAHDVSGWSVGFGLSF